MDLTVTLSMITLSVSRTFGSMTQLDPMVQFLMVVFSDITLPSPTKHSDPNWKRNPIWYPINIRDPDCKYCTPNQERGYRAQPIQKSISQRHFCGFRFRQLLLFLPLVFRIFSFFSYFGLHNNIHSDRSYQSLLRV